MLAQQSHWSLKHIILHWLTAVAVICLYGLGWWMMELDYYDSWYRTAPFWHKSVGLLLVFLVVVRLFVRVFARSPEAIVKHAKWERGLSHLVHASLYVLLFIVFASGYLISTADGRGISFFGWFDVPALVTSIDDQEDLAGWVHDLSTNALIWLAGFHAIGALKHHFIDRDATLKRMLFPKKDT